ncbi:MAG: hypothetical protein AAGF67_03305 [Verrucomicrobiota bacterium]
MAGLAPVRITRHFITLSFRAKPSLKFAMPWVSRLFLKFFGPDSGETSGEGDFIQEFPKVNPLLFYKIGPKPLFRVPFCLTFLLCGDLPLP